MSTDAFARRDKLQLGRQLGVPVVSPAAGVVSSVTILGKDQQMAGEKAPKDGVYEYEGKRGRFRIKKGDVLPEGATFVDPEKEAAPAPKANAKGKGPSENTATTGPSETA